MAHLLALDEGTTSARAIVFDHHGQPCAIAQREFPQYFPQPGWVEQEPQEIWETQVRVAGEALRRAGLKPHELTALGITNQRETTVVWERRTGRPIHRAIVWQDRRTAPLCAKLRARGVEPLVRRRTGLLLDPYFSATKLAWLLDHVSGARRRAARGELAFGTIDTWLLWQLTGGRRHATDPSNAARTLLYNLRTGQWDAELLRLFRVPPEILPTVRASSEVYGEVTAPRALAGVTIGGVAGDQQAALFGQMCVRPGLTKTTYGTGCFMLQHTGTQPVTSNHRLLTTVAWRIGGRTEYALEGSVFTGGAVVQWLRDSLGLIRTAADIEKLAKRVPDSGGVVFVPAFTGLGAPHWDPHARGLVLGLTQATSAAHLARAALESIAFQVADLQDAMRADTGTNLKELRVDGGAAGNNLLLQFQADLLGVPVVRPAVTESTALGAAYLAGLATGVWKNAGQITKQWRAERTFEPGISRDRAHALQSQWRRAVERAKGWVQA